MSSVFPKKNILDHVRIRKLQAQYHSHNLSCTLKLTHFSIFPSNPSCTDIMEIYNAVEEMDDDDVSLAGLSLVCLIFSCHVVRNELGKGNLNWL